MKKLHLYMLITLFLTGVGQNALAASGRLAGEVTLDYATFSEKEGAQENDKSHFTQLLNLLYSKRGEVMQRRLGQYSLMLGGEVARGNFTDDQSARDETLSTHKIYYNADLKLAPQGLPFRLHLFAKDAKNTTFEERYRAEENVYSSDRQLFNSGHLMDPHIFTDISNGTSNTLGATLLVGIRNGSYLGRYREMLSTLPQLMIDYQQTTRRDLKSLTPVHTRSRDLAFVSLNKKDNWLHYRVYDFADYLNSANDYERKQIILGVIDPYLSRKWINLTNWIKLSTDLTYTRETQHVFQNFANHAFLKQSYDLNLFTTMNGPNFLADNFATYHRSRTGLQLEERLSLPLSVRFEQNRDSLWRFRWETNKWREENVANLSTFNKINHYGHLNLETRRTKDYNLTLGLGVEQNKEQDEMANSVNFSLELGRGSLSRRSSSRTNDCRLYLASRWLDGETALGQSVQRMEQSAQVSYRQPVSRSWTLGLTDSASYSEGDISQVRGNYITFNNDASLDGQKLTGRKTQRNNFAAYVEHILTPNTSNRVMFTSNWLRIGDTQQEIYMLSQNLKYRGRQLRGYFNNNFQAGDFPTMKTVATAFLDNSTARQEWVFKHNSGLAYKPNREFEVGYDFDIAYEKYTQGESRKIGRIEQNAQYSFWVTNGVIRKLLELTEEASWEWIDHTGENWQVQDLKLQAEYYPQHALFIGGAAEYQQTIAENADNRERLLGKVWAGALYSKFKFDISYAYGLRPETDAAAERTEKRFQVRMTKVI